MNNASAQFHRWSLRSLAELERNTRSMSEQLLQCVVERLSLQVNSLTSMIDWTNDELSFIIDSNVLHNAQKRLDTLRYIHQSTHKLANQILTSPNILKRYNEPDRHVINTTFQELRARHINTIETMVDVVTDIRRNVDRNERKNLNSLYNYADIFLQRRLGIQLLCDHHIDLYKGITNGAVSVNTLIEPIVEDSIIRAQQIVDVHLHTYPDTIRHYEEKDVKCTYIQPWLQHIIVEILKNAMASTVRQMKKNNNDNVPDALHIHICTIDDKWVEIRVVDYGTGVIDENIEELFILGHTSAERKWDRLQIQQSYAAVRPPLSSLGVGLPTSRYMVEHFGGTLTLENNNNDNNENDRTNGCTARIRLPINDTILERVPGGEILYKPK